MKKIVTLLILTLVYIASASAQAPIKWRMTVKMAGETEGTLTLKAIVEPGWHLYGTTLPDGGPKPTSFVVSSAGGVTFTSSLKPSREPLKVQDKMFGMNLNWWDSTITFTQNFKLANPQDKPQIKAQVTFMGCNDQTCLPPKTETLTYTFK